MYVYNTITEVNGAGRTYNEAACERVRPSPWLRAA